jgi:hypothetical protein
MDENPKRTDEHPLSEHQTNTDDKKLPVAVAAITDPTFPLPELNDKSSILDYILSFITLFVLLGLGLCGAWLFDASMLQSSQPLFVLSTAFTVIVAALFLTGTVWVNWWELVLGYWWLSMPIGALAGLVLVLNQEASTGLEESS